MEKKIELNESLLIDDILDLFRHEQYFFMLDSNKDNDIQSCHSFIGVKPADYLEIKEGGHKSIQEFNDFYHKHRKERSDKAFPDFFCFLTYDLGVTFVDVDSRFSYDSKIPKGYIGYYPVIIVKDNISNALSLIYDQKYEREALEIKKRCDDYTRDKLQRYKPVFKYTYEEKYGKYKEKIKRIKDYIYEGDAYQINYTRRFSGLVDNADYNKMYLRLRKSNPAPFSAFIRNDEWAILSSSPERLIKSEDGILETRPIKGTIKRGSNIISDYLNKLRLKNSPKDKSELLMIVDLERNDLSRVSKSGSVRVEELYKLETYETVHHLVSTIKSDVQEGNSPFDVLYRIFPGGSITGTPKKRAVEIIDELEEYPRGIYTGTIGYVKDNGDFDFNIAIRTIVMEKNRFDYNVGGGITWMSEAESEYLETEHKGLGLKRSLDLEL